MHNRTKMSPPEVHVQTHLLEDQMYGNFNWECSPRTSKSLTFRRHCYINNISFMHRAGHTGPHWERKTQTFSTSVDDEIPLINQWRQCPLVLSFHLTYTYTIHFNKMVLTVWSSLHVQILAPPLVVYLAKFLDFAQPQFLHQKKSITMPAYQSGWMDH